MDREERFSRASTNSHSTIHSIGSSIAGARASLASTNTIYSRHSLPNADHSGRPPSNAYFVNATQPLPQDGTIGREHTNTHHQPEVTKRAHSQRVACFHCDCTFGKASDWKKHFQKICLSLGPGTKALLCTECANLSRTMDQAGQHCRQKHRGCVLTDADKGKKVEEVLHKKVTLPSRQFFACVCGMICSDSSQFFVHLGKAKCNVFTSYDKTTEPHMDHHARVIALLQVGKAGGANGIDIGIYSTVLAFFRKQRVPPAALDCLKDATDQSGTILMDNNEAQRRANQLEWGVTSNERLLAAGNGFIEYSRVIEALLGPLCLWCRHGSTRSSVSRSIDQEPTSVVADIDIASRDMLNQPQALHGTALATQSDFYPCSQSACGRQYSYPDPTEQQVSQVSSTCEPASADLCAQGSLNTCWPDQFWDVDGPLTEQEPDSALHDHRYTPLASRDWQSVDFPEIEDIWQPSHSLPGSSHGENTKSKRPLSFASALTDTPAPKHYRSANNNGNDQITLTMDKIPESEIDDVLKYYSNGPENRTSPVFEIEDNRVSATSTSAEHPMTWTATLSLPTFLDDETCDDGTV